MQLLVHPGTPRGPVRNFEVDANRHPGGTLHLSYRLDADLGQLRLPISMTPARADDLWRHTCFEAFISGPGSPGYSELNFSPSGQWAAYTFTGRRTGRRKPDLTNAPALIWRCTDGRLELDAEICLDGLWSAPAETTLRVALSAVVEEQSGTISYWALRHPDKQPDFHHPEGFVLELPGHEPATKRGA
jgi:hypothetical protein